MANTEELLKKWSLTPQDYMELMHTAFELWISGEFQAAFTDTTNELSGELDRHLEAQEALEARLGLIRQIQAAKRLIAAEFADARVQVIELKKEYIRLGVDLSCLERLEELAFGGPTIIIERSGWAERLRNMPTYEHFGLRHYTPKSRTSGSNPADGSKESVSSKESKS